MTTNREKIEIAPSGRIDYCVDCGKEHGYDCPLSSLPEQGDELDWKERLFRCLVVIFVDVPILNETENDFDGGRSGREARVLNDGTNKRAQYKANKVMGIVLSAVSQERQKAVEEERARILKLLPEERIIHSYMESQNTGENRGWNEYRSAAIEAIINPKQ